MSFSQLVKGIIKGEFNESFTPHRADIMFFGTLLVAGAIVVIGFFLIDPFELAVEIGREI